MPPTSAWFVNWVTPVTQETTSQYTHTRELRHILVGGHPQRGGRGVQYIVLLGGDVVRQRAPSIPAARKCPGKLTQMVTVRWTISAGTAAVRIHRLLPNPYGYPRAMTSSHSSLLWWKVYFRLEHSCAAAISRWSTVSSDTSFSRRMSLMSGIISCRTSSSSVVCVAGLPV